ncbi:MAG: murein transglycosylase A [Desulfobacterales bacterium]
MSRNKIKPPAAYAAAAFLAILLCAYPAAAAEIRQVPSGSLPGLSDDLGCEDLAEAVAQSIAYYERLPQNRKFDFGGDSYSAGQLAAGMKRFKALVEKKPPQSRINEFLRENARVYEFAEQQSPVRVLFTGYYEPRINGSRTRTDEFRYPVYSRPSDLLQADLSDFGIECDENTIIARRQGEKLVPYFDRKTIETKNVLESRAEAIAWTDDPVSLFFLHVQGSGTIKMRNGDTLRVGYDITNGRPYRSIGKYLIDKGEISRQEMSMQAIAGYIRQNPSEMDEIFFYNPRYVFFRETEEKSPRGSLGAKLTPGRSVALDQKITPSGALLFVSGEKPVPGKSGEVESWEPFTRFMCSQDAGSAIRGPKRADIFWGSGEYAKTAAGYMKHRGRLYFIAVEPESGEF